MDAITIQAFFDASTSTMSYVISDSESRQAAVIDPVLDYDVNASSISTGAADKIISYLSDAKLDVAWLLETHAHADHLSSAAYLKAQVGGQIAIGRGIREIQAAFKSIYNFGDDFAIDGSQFDRLLQPGQLLQLGAHAIHALAVPGHTCADMAFQVADAVFVGDTLFMPDVGTGRTDFPGGDARALYQSIQRLYALPPRTRMFVGHAYPPAGRPQRGMVSVAEQRARKIHLRDGITEDQFVSMREARDAKLPAPKLLLPAMQVNLRAGMPPAPEGNGVSYLKIPIQFPVQEASYAPWK